MSRNKVNKVITEPMGDRLEELVVNYLRLSWVDFSKRLGYTNSSTLHKVRNGTAAMTAEKLHDIASLEFPEGKVNLNWLVTGEGSPFRNPLDESNVANIKTTPLFSDENALVLTLINVLQRANKS